MATPPPYPAGSAVASCCRPRSHRSPLLCNHHTPDTERNFQALHQATNYIPCTFLATSGHIPIYPLRRIAQRNVYLKRFPGGPVDPDPAAALHSILNPCRPDALYHLVLGDPQSSRSIPRELMNVPYRTLPQASRERSAYAVSDSAGPLASERTRAGVGIPRFQKQTGLQTRCPGNQDTGQFLPDEATLNERETRVISTASSDLLVQEIAKP